MAKSILSLCSAYHDSNLSACVDKKVSTIEFERLFGNRYLAFERLSVEKKIGLLTYAREIFNMFWILSFNKISNWPNKREYPSQTAVEKYNQFLK